MAALARKTPKHTVYRIWYGDLIVYVGRTNQPLHTRIRGHLFQKPMHRSISIEQVSKIEYHEFETEADMNLYEIYYILTLHPPLNVDDKTKDYPTVQLPEVEWSLFQTHLWDKWVEQIMIKENDYERMLRRNREIFEEAVRMRKMFRDKTISEEELANKLAVLDKEKEELDKKMKVWTSLF